MRIISGECRGRKLTQIRGRDIRPTSDRVREALFNILGLRVRDARVLDLFCGTGALGLEALSRGAAGAVLVDKSDASCEAARQNIELCRMTDRASLVQWDILARPLPESVTGRAYDLVFIDPPYNRGLLQKTLEKESLVKLLAPDAVIIGEQSAKERLDNNVKGLDIFRQKKYSKTLISFLTPKPPT